MKSDSRNREQRVTYLVEEVLVVAALLVVPVDMDDVEALWVDETEDTDVEPDEDFDKLLTWYTVLVVVLDTMKLLGLDEAVLLVEPLDPDELTVDWRV